jgi:hypothetical protein
MLHPPLQGEGRSPERSGGERGGVLARGTGTTVTPPPCPTPDCLRQQGAGFCPPPAGEGVDSPLQRRV